MLDAAPGSGDWFALLVVGGEPDYCNDGNSLCPYDSVVARIQSLYAEGVTTLVGGLPMKSVVAGDVTRYGAALQSYANAGVGLPVATIGDTTANIYYQCMGVPEWSQEFSATSKPALQAIGSYSNSPGAAAYTAIDTTSASTLAASFDALLSRTRSCVFDIDTFAVVPQQASSGTVKVGAGVVPFDDSNGWRLSGLKAIELTGSARADWRTPGAKQLSVTFPCAAITQ